MKKAVPFIAAVLAFIIFRSLGPAQITKILAAVSVGLVCGLLPFGLTRRRSPEFAKTSLWVCAVAGFVGGALLAVPAAVVMSLVGHFKSRSSDR